MKNCMLASNRTVKSNYNHMKFSSYVQPYSKEEDTYGRDNKSLITPQSGQDSPLEQYSL